MSTIEYNKLIRDRIPEIIKNSGKTPIVKVVEGEELLKLLNTKLYEELEEYSDSGDIEELADLVEVVQAILDYKGITTEKFNKIRQDKNEKRGALKKGLILERVISD